jgi:hypothetical protein
VAGSVGRYHSQAVLVHEDRRDLVRVQPTAPEPSQKRSAGAPRLPHSRTNRRIPEALTVSAFIRLVFYRLLWWTMALPRLPVVCRTPRALRQ